MDEHAGGEDLKVARMVGRLLLAGVSHNTASCIFSNIVLIATDAELSAAYTFGMVRPLSL